MKSAAVNHITPVAERKPTTLKPVDALPSLYGSDERVYRYHVNQGGDDQASEPVPTNRPKPFRS